MNFSGEGYFSPVCWVLALSTHVSCTRTLVTCYILVSWFPRPLWWWYVGTWLPPPPPVVVDVGPYMAWLRWCTSVPCPNLGFRTIPFEGGINTEH